MPTQDVINEVARQATISLRAADEIIAQARSTSAAYNRADALVPYDHAPDQVLTDDWNRLAACGPELSEAVERAQDVLELLTARIAGSRDHNWMDTAAQHAAQVYDSVIKAQPLLAPLGSLIPERSQPDSAAGQERLIELDRQGALAGAATAAARARAVQEWSDRDNGPEPNRARKVEAAAPGTRTLLHLNRVLAAVDPTRSQDAFANLDPQRVAEVVRALGRLSIQAQTLRVSPPQQAPNPVGHSTQQHHHPPGPGPASGTPRPAP